ncbi:tetratricopeptide repeat protein [Flavicella marina]|uniref:tetratricopeptide repeat protein n=1 Tax=Flavicella marina TaxID=1475951 RepID=UPI00186B4F5E|nr:tetratricopeptide repeat protein [Flavicella marina]
MKFFRLLAVVILLTSSATSQTYEERIADLSCEYIQDIDITNDVEISMKKCILQAKFEVEQKHPELKPNISIEELRAKYKEIFALISKNCPSLTSKKSAHKKHLNYIPSINKEAVFNFDKGNRLSDEKNYKAAITAYKKAIRLDENYCMAYDQLGIAHMQINETKKAIKFFKTSLKLFPEGDIALLNIGEAYLSLEDIKDASVYFSTLLSYYPTNADAYLGLSKTELLDELNEPALLHAIFAANNSDTNDEVNSKAYKIIDDIYNVLKNKGQIEIFNNIAKENNFVYNK